MDEFVFDILGLKEELQSNNDDVDELMKLILQLRTQAKETKNYQLADIIRDELGRLNYTIKDSKDGSSWNKN